MVYAGVRLGIKPQPKFCSYMLLITLQLIWCTIGSATKIRGVNPILLDRYQPDADGMFHCLNDSTIAIPADRINDNYCDCPDGSDEPGTSACSNSKFYCENEGFFPHYIPSSWVDDGVCDYEKCCDGTDEPKGKCPNRCAEFKDKYERERLENNGIVDKGVEIRNGIIAKSQHERLQIQHELDRLTHEMGDLQSKLKQLNKVKETRNLEDGKLINNAFEDYERNLEDARKVVDLQMTQHSDLTERVHTLEKLLQTMKDNYNHNFNDPAVKLAAHSFEDYVANKGILKNVNNDGNSKVKNQLDELHTSFETSKDKLLDEWQKKQEGKKSGSWFHFSAEDIVDAFLGIRSLDESSELNKQHSSVGPARLAKNIEDLESKIKECNQSITSDKQSLAKDYGPNDILRSQNGCISHQIGEYNYRLCFTGELSQIDSNRHGVRIGHFESASFSDDGKTLISKYSGGEKCWNGPIRSAEVRMKCGLRNEILAVSEPEKCGYMVEVKSPMACQESQKY